MATECAICVESFNRTTHKRVSCCYCEHEACNKCVERYLIENTIVPQCMSCKAEWNMEFLRGRLSRTFMDKQYRDHQKDALLSEAETQIGQYQRLAQRQEQIDTTKDEIQSLKQTIREARDALDRAQYRLYRLQNPIEMEDDNVSAERRDFFMACPGHECRGLLSTAYKCGLCAHYFCAQCHGDKGATRDGEHECKKEDVDTIALLRDNTRPCPKCHQGIYKVSGCDQMWCTACHTCFSWNTGNILNGTVHNPHFYEFQRQLGNGVAPRVAGDIPCGGVPTLHQMRDRLSKERDETAKSHILQLHRLTNHITDITMPRVMQRFNQRTEIQQTSGVQYLRKMISREAWRDKLYRASRQEEKYRRYYQVLQTLTVNLAEMLRQYVMEEPAKRILGMSEQLIDYSNAEMNKMRKQYSMVLPVLSRDMDTTRL